MPLRLAVVCLATIGAVATYAALSDLGKSQVALMMWGALGVALGLVWHEGGHLLCARLGGLPVRLVSVGIGPVLLRLRVGQVPVELRPIPLGGWVTTYPILVVRKFRMLTFVLGGVLGNVALIGSVAALAAVGAVPDGATNSLSAIVVAQFYLITTSLIPARVKVDGVKLATDGLQLLQLLWSPRQAVTAAGNIYAEMHARYAGPGEPTPATSSASSRILYLVSDPRKWADAGAARANLDALERELGGNLAREEELLVLDSLVTTGLIWSDATLHGRLDEWSVRALQLGPEVETLRGSRGSALVELGRWEEGKAMLAKVAAAEGSFDLFMTQIYLARAEHALGNAVEAERLVRAARATGATSPESPAVRILLPRLEAELGIQPQQQTG